jgi:hypothetical protein
MPNKATSPQLFELIERVQSGDRAIVTLMALQQAAGNQNILGLLDQLELLNPPPEKISGLVCGKDSDADPVAGGAGKPKPKPTRKPPDMDICRAQSSGHGDDVD